MMSFVSNTLASSHNQKLLCAPTPTKARVFYRVFHAGRYDYSITFCDEIDSTFADGKESYADLACGDWCVENAVLGVCDTLDPTAVLSQSVALTFGGLHAHTFQAKEIVSSDPVSLCVTREQYLCVEYTFFGNRLPYHPENMIPCFVEQNGVWVASKAVALPSKIACNVSVKKRIAFWGDSITQGIGVGENTYLHYAAIAASLLGNDYAYWDIGIGYGRAQDAALCGAWMKKALQNDVVTVCFGVNDIIQGRSADQIKSDLTRIVDHLLQNGVCVLLQTIPPFDYPPHMKAIWEEVNAYIKEVLFPRADAVLDVVPLLQLSDSEPHRAKFGGHPNAEGAAIWGKALACVLQSLWK